MAYLLAAMLLVTSSFGVSYAGADPQGERLNELQSKAQNQSESRKETESKKQSESQKETESEKQSESQKETESEKQSESQKETESEKQSESQKETESEKQSESQKETESEKQSESQKESESEKETEKQPQTSELPADRGTVLSTVRNYLLQKNSNPDFSSIWNVIGLKRSGMDVPKSYTDTFYKNVYAYCEQKNWKITRTKYSDYSKLIMALTSIGIDAQDVGGHNLFDYLSDYENVRMQGINGPIWALIALNCHPSYSIPENKEAAVQNSEEMLIREILAAQCTDGGWNLAGGQGDSDMTGMALQALSFYYGKRADVTASIDRGLAWISKNQLASGGFGTQGVETSESVAQILVALSGVGIDANKDARFVKNGKSPLHGLFQYYLPEGGFMHVTANAGNNGGGIGGMLDGMATEQGFYATVAYQRLLDGRSFIYDMSDVELTSGKTEDTSQNGGTDETKKQEETEKKNNQKKDNKTDNKKKDDKKNKDSKKETEKKNTESETKQTNAGSTAKAPSGQTKTLPSAKKTTASKEKSSSTATKKKATAKKKKNKKESEDSGWSFDGEDYVPELTSDGGTEAETVMQSADADSKTKVRTMAPAVLSGAALVVVLEALAYAVYRKKKGRKLR